MSTRTSLPQLEPGDWSARHRASIQADAGLATVFKTARDCWIEDEAGRRYVDFIAGYGVVGSGWQREEILRAMAAQLGEACFAPPWLPTRESVRLAEFLLKIAPHGLIKCARATGGADANEVALRAAGAGRGGIVLSLRRAYHGGSARTLGLSEPTDFGLPLSRFPSHAVAPPYCFRCPFGKTYPGCSLECADELDRAANRPGVAAFLFEPILGSGGVIVPPPEYFHAVNEICQRRGIRLIVDEVITAMGRVGAWFATELFGLHADAVTLAKGLSSGYVPIGAVLMNEGLSAELGQSQDVTATFAWTPLACAGTLANLKLLRDEELPRRASEMGPRLRQAVRDLFARHLPQFLGEVRGIGMMVGIELVEDPVSKTPNRRLVQRLSLLAHRNGLMLGTSWDWTTLVLLPPLILDDTMLEEGLARLEATLKRFRRD